MMTMIDLRSQAMKVWRIGLSEQVSAQETVPQSWQPLGGRALLARMLLDEIDASCDPLSPENKLILA